MDLVNYSDENNNNKSITNPQNSTKRKATNCNQNTGIIKATHCKVNKGNFNQDMEMPTKKSHSISSRISINKDNTNCKKVYNTKTYTTCKGQHLRFNEADSHIEGVYSRLETHYPYLTDDVNDVLNIYEHKYKINEKDYTEKGTYCRPVFNLYNQEFIFKTLERNAKLQRIVQRLLQTRQLEKRNDNWNNFINDLRNKHRYDDANQVPQYNAASICSNTIDDYYKSTFDCKQTKPYSDVLRDLYKARENCSSNNLDDRDDDQTMPDINQYIFGTNSYCYPTSSQGSVQIQNKGRLSNRYVGHWENRYPSRYYRGNTIVIDRDYYRAPKMNVHSRKQTLNKAVEVNFNTNLMSKSVSVQRDLKNNLSKEYFEDNIVTYNTHKMKEEMINYEKEESLINIGTKLNQLMATLNAVLDEIKIKQSQPVTNTGVDCKFNDDHNVNTTRSDTFGLKSKLENVTYTQYLNERTTEFVDSGRTYQESNMSRINEILNEEINKSNNIKQDIERLLSRKAEKPCSVKITFDVPTKERCTEVTASLSRATTNMEKWELIEDIDPPSKLDDNRMTIAVNTDPLSLLALLRISTDTVKQMLSCMPNIDYYSYLSMLQPLSRSTVSHYVCNICGAAFDRPSQLSDHIQAHNLGKTRDCCVCRHVLDSQRPPNNLFSCKYCGQRFTRAYCCELHQQTCAMALGVKHGDHSELLLLT